MILGGLGLQIVFIILKLAEAINWPWVWVLLPFWGGLVIIIVLLLLIALEDA